MGIGVSQHEVTGGPLLVDTRIVVGTSRAHFQDRQCCFVFFWVGGGCVAGVLPNGIHVNFGGNIQEPPILIGRRPHKERLKSGWYVTFNWEKTT